jgi:hypothetical protein
MALKSCGILPYPSPARSLYIALFSSSAQYEINATGNRVGWVFQVPKSGTVNKLGVRVNAAATPILSRIGLYTVDGSGQPTTTPYGGGGYETWTPAANTFSEVTIGSSAGTPYTMTAGDYAALVVEFDSTAGDYFLSATNGNGLGVSFGYFAKFTGTWAKSSSSTIIAASLGYNDGTYGDIGGFACSGVPTTGTYNSGTLAGSGGDEYALAFTVPFKCRVAGAWTAFSSVAGADFELDLYSGTTVIGQAAVDGDYVGSTASVNLRTYLFASPATLTAGSSYYISARPTTANNLTYRYFTLPAAAMVQGAGFFPATCGLATRTDQGAWGATDTTKIPYLGILIDQIDDGTGGGGLLRPVSMNGGF